MVDISAHAKKRIKQRMGHVPDKVAEMARERGISHKALTGSIRRYVDYLRCQGGIREAYVYNNQTFLFGGKEDKLVLVTVIPLPARYQKYVGKLKDGEA